MASERGEEWERLRHRIQDCYDRCSVLKYPYEIGKEIMWEFKDSRIHSPTLMMAIMSEGRLDAATDYLWSLGVRA